MPFVEAVWLALAQHAVSILWVLIPLIVACALFMENLDSTVISTSLPAIAMDLHEDPISLKLALTSYLISLAIFIPASGWAADRFGARTIFRAAILVFILGSILCGISATLPGLVGARVIQGLGGALFALATGDTKGNPEEVTLNVPAIDEKIASALGTAPMGSAAIIATISMIAPNASFAMIPQNRPLAAPTPTPLPGVTLAGGTASTSAPPAHNRSSRGCVPSSARWLGPICF